MKHLLPILVICLLSSTALAQLSDLDYKEEDFIKSRDHAKKFRIQKINVHKFKYKKGELTNDTIPYLFETYDGRGKIRKRIQHNFANPEHTTTTVFKFDKQDNLLKEERETISFMEDRLYVRKYKYNEQGIMIKAREGNDDVGEIIVMLQTAYKIDSLGRRYARSSMGEKMYYTYGENGKLAYLTTKVDTLQTYFYDSLGQQVKIIDYISTQYFIYDKRGLLLEKVAYPHGNEGDNYEYKFLFKYDNQGNEIEEKGWSVNGKFLQHITFQYDKDGLLQQETDHDDKGKPQTLFKYSYVRY